MLRVEGFQNGGGAYEHLEYQGPLGHHRPFGGDCEPDPPLWTVVPNKALSLSLPETWDIGTLEILVRGNVIIRRAQKTIQAAGICPRRRSSSRFPLLTPTRVSFEPGASAVACARAWDRGCLAEV